LHAARRAPRIVATNGQLTDTFAGFRTPGELHLSLLAGYLPARARPCQQVAGALQRFLSVEQARLAAWPCVDGERCALRVQAEEDLARSAQMVPLPPAGAYARIEERC
jgi:hypothetical protein